MKYITLFSHYFNIQNVNSSKIGNVIDIADDATQLQRVELSEMEYNE